MPETRLLSSLRWLYENKINFILVEELAAVLQGAPIQTYDVDVVYSKDNANVDRLLPAVLAMDAIFRFQPDRRLPPNRSHLAGGGHLNLLTHYGPLDLLGSIGQGLTFADLLPHSTELNISDDVMIRILDLDMIITLKEQLAGDKDIAVLPVLRQTLSERKKKHS